MEKIISLNQIWFFWGLLVRVLFWKRKGKIKSFFCINFTSIPNRKISVAAILRQSGLVVELVVSRPILLNDVDDNDASKTRFSLYRPDMFVDTFYCSVSWVMSNRAASKIYKFNMFCKYKLYNAIIRMPRNISQWNTKSSVQDRKWGCWYTYMTILIEFESILKGNNKSFEWRSKEHQHCIFTEFERINWWTDYWRVISRSAKIGWLWHPIG